MNEGLHDHDSQAEGNDQILDSETERICEELGHDIAERIKRFMPPPRNKALKAESEQ